MIVTLFSKIQRISDEQDMEIVWEIIQIFEPYIRKECYNYSTKRVDEDMLSEILAKLPERLVRFRIMLDEEEER